MAAAAELELPPALHPSYTHSQYSDTDLTYDQNSQPRQEQEDQGIQQQHQPRKWLWSDEVDDEDENQDWVERLHIEEQRELWARQSQQHQQQQQEAQLKEQLRQQEREQQVIADQELVRQQQQQEQASHQHQQQDTIMSWRSTTSTKEQLRSFRQRTMENNASETWQTDLNLRYHQDVDDEQLTREDDGDALASQYQLMEELGSEYTCNTVHTFLPAIPSPLILTCTPTDQLFSFASI